MLVMMIIVPHKNIGGNIIIVIITIVILKMTGMIKIMVCLTRTSVGTTSRSRKNSERSRAISAKEFCKVKCFNGDGDGDGDGDGNQQT